MTALNPKNFKIEQISGRKYSVTYWPDDEPVITSYGTWYKGCAVVWWEFNSRRQADFWLIAIRHKTRDMKTVDEMLTALENGEI